MLTIVPVDNGRRQALARTYGFPDIQVMAALCGEQEEGSGVFLYEGEVLVLLKLAADSPAVLDGLLRAILNAGRRAGMKLARCEEPELADFLISEGFDRQGAALSADLAAFFDRPCRAGHGN